MIGEPKEPNMYENQQPQAGEPVSAEINPEGQDAEGERENNIPLGDEWEKTLDAREAEYQKYLESVKPMVEAEGQMTAKYEEPAREKDKENKWRKWTAGLMAGTVLAIGLGLPALAEGKGGKGFDWNKASETAVKAYSKTLEEQRRIEAERAKLAAKKAEQERKRYEAELKAEQERIRQGGLTQRNEDKYAAQSGVLTPSQGGRVVLRPLPGGGSERVVEPGGRETEQRGESQAEAYLHQLMVDKAIKDYINGTPEIPKDAPIEHQKTYAFQYNKMVRDIPKEGRSMLPMP